MTFLQRVMLTLAAFLVVVAVVAEATAPPECASASTATIAASNVTPRHSAHHAPRPMPTVTYAEDDPRFDCRTMGNDVCGTKIGDRVFLVYFENGLPVYVHELPDCSRVATPAERSDAVGNAYRGGFCEGLTDVDDATLRAVAERGVHDAALYARVTP